MCTEEINYFLLFLRSKRGDTFSKIMNVNSVLFHFFFPFLGLLLQHIEVPGLCVESELQLQAYTTGIATQDLSRICDPHLQQCWIPNPLSEVRDETRILLDTTSVS